MVAFYALSVRWKLGLTLCYMLGIVSRSLRVLRHCLRFVGESSGRAVLKYHDLSPSELSDVGQDSLGGVVIMVGVSFSCSSCVQRQS